MKAVVIATGDELVRGAHVDTNSALVARALAGLSLECERFVVLGDDEQALVDELTRCLREGVVAIVGGGLGPTLDDVTRAAFARALSTTLERDMAVDLRLRELFVARGREYSESNARQALFPRDARVLRNERGTADGFACERGRALLVALPGPPRELEPMLRGEVLDLVRAHLARHAPELGVARTAVFKLSRLPESRFADLCGDWMARGRNPLVGVTASLGVLTATIRARGRDDAEAGTLLGAQVREFRERFAEWIHAEGEVELETLLVEELRARRHLGAGRVVHGRHGLRARHSRSRREQRLPARLDDLLQRVQERRARRPPRHPRGPRRRQRGSRLRHGARSRPPLGRPHRLVDHRHRGARWGQRRQAGGVGVAGAVRGWRRAGARASVLGAGAGLGARVRHPGWVVALAGGG